MITLKITLENDASAIAFAELLSKFNFVHSVEIPELSKTFLSAIQNNTENTILQPINKDNPSKYYGLWAHKNISDVKQFRNDLWLRKK